MWFWMCTEQDDDASLIVLQPVSKDNELSTLWAQASAQVPEGARQQIGIASLTEQGIASFGGEALEVSDLTRLASWVEKNHDAHPGLARLRDAELVLLEGDAIISNIAIPILWRNVPQLPVPGSLDEAAHRLKKLRVDHNFWFWMTDSGPNKRPFLVLDRQHRDPKGHRFAERIQLQRRRSPVQGSSFEGVLRVGPDGELIFTTNTDAAAGRAILESLLTAEPERFSALANSTVAQTKDGQVVDILPAGESTATLDLSKQCSLLENLGTKGPVWFWLTSADESGSPLLLLAYERDNLQDKAKQAGGDGSTLRGELQRSKAGWIEIRSRQFWPEGLSVLAQWIEQHHQRWPALRLLKNARMTQRDRAGELLNRHKEDAVWDSIPAL